MQRGKYLCTYKAWRVVADNLFLQEHMIIKGKWPKIKLSCFENVENIIFFINLKMEIHIFSSYLNESKVLTELRKQSLLLPLDN